MQSYKIIAHGILDDTRVQFDDEFDMTEPEMQVYMIDIENGEAINDETRDSIHSRFHERCSCQHDCCGHRFGGVSNIAMMRKGRYLVTVCTQRNY